MHSAQSKPAIEMKRMFLPEVQDNPQPSPYFDLIQSARNSGQEYWQIWHLFAFRAEITAYLARFTHDIMHEPSPLSSGLRELIAEKLRRTRRILYRPTTGAALARNHGRFWKFRIWEPGGPDFAYGHLNPT